MAFAFAGGIWWGRSDRGIWGGRIGSLGLIELVLLPLTSLLGGTGHRDLGLDIKELPNFHPGLVHPVAAKDAVGEKPTPIFGLSRM